MCARPQGRAVKAQKSKKINGSIRRVSQNRPQYTRILVIRIPKKGDPDFVANSHFSQLASYVDFPFRFHGLDDDT